MLIQWLQREKILKWVKNKSCEILHTWHIHNTYYIITYNDNTACQIILHCRTDYSGHFSLISPLTHIPQYGIDNTCTCKWHKSLNSTMKKHLE